MNFHLRHTPYDGDDSDCDDSRLVSAAAKISEAKQVIQKFYRGEHQRTWPTDVHKYDPSGGDIVPESAKLQIPHFVRDDKVGWLGEPPDSLVP
jgi:hypothetical protein